jgi:hypothetical protein
VILDVLGGLPKENRHCAFLAARAFHEARDHCMRQQRTKMLGNRQDDEENLSRVWLKMDEDLPRIRYASDQFSIS